MIQIIEKGKMDYLDSIREMEEVVDSIINETEDEQIWFVEYDNLYTAGSGEKATSNQINSVPLFQTNRGGKITFHGKGQIIIYFMINLKKLFFPNQPDIVKFIYMLEEIVIQSLKNIGLNSVRLPVNHGVWINNHKIAAIGIRVQRWITYHGIAINFNTDLSFYDYITPCGLTSEYGVTSISKELKNQNIISIEKFKIILKANILEALQYKNI